ncbi:5-oxoprolinase subunit B family protein [Aidingimonas lacisalsi]|uniref:5-oxoprolinase subunit B family protein n=1 Tax=Aidingimonas lacisalsi TaxID=2604086 RepID=UPI001F34F9B3|nr:allophanate hydrolase subunit 1 [Aidingimonas lacisalsi]
MTLPRLENAGIDAWLVRLFETIDETNMPWLTALCRECEAAFGSALIDLVPSYTTVLIHYDPLQYDASEAKDCLLNVLNRLVPDEQAAETSFKEVPVWYDESVGPELTRLASVSGLERDDVIAIHQARDYRVFALGFAPGYAFMGRLDERLVVPRLTTPRQRVPAGSVAVAERQTAAYPSLSPGGWNLIGRTPVTLFDRHRDGFSLLQVGDRVRFVAIDRDTFVELGGDVRPVTETRTAEGA